MRRRPEHLRPILVEVAAFLAGGLLRLVQITIDNLNIPYSPAVAVTACFVYVGTFAWWRTSLRQRLLPSRLRSLAETSAVAMAAMIVVRELKYRHAGLSPSLTLFCWYLYYPLRLMFPLLLLLAGLSLIARRRGRERGSKALQAALVMVALVISVGVLTNDVHHLAFAPNNGLPLSDTGGYSYGPVYFAATLFEVACTLACVLILLRNRTGQLRGRPWAIALAPMSTAYALLLVRVLLLDPAGIRSVWEFPEITCFGMLLTWEALIYLGVFPHNERYAELFEATTLPLRLADSSLATVYETSIPIQASADELRAALAAPVALTRDTRLEGHALQAGYTFWESDLSAINRMNDELAEVTEDLSEQNDLLAAENDLRERQERIAARTAVYEHAVGELVPQLTSLREHVAQLDAEAPDLAEELAWANVEGAYVKRAVNLRLVAAERPSLDVRDLVSCVDETLRALRQLGVACSVTARGGSSVGSGDAIALYGAFQQVIELAGRQIGGLLVHVDVDAPALDLELEPSAACTAEELVALLADAGIAAFEEDDTVFAHLVPAPEVSR